MLFNGTIIKSAVSRHWCFALCLHTHPYTSTHPHGTHPEVHSVALLDVNASENLETAEVLWRNRNIQLVKCAGFFIFSTKNSTMVLKGQRGRRGSYQLTAMPKVFKNKTKGRCHNICLACFVQFRKIKQNQNRSQPTKI